MVRTATIAGTTIVLLLSAARFSAMPAERTTSATASTEAAPPTRVAKNVAKLTVRGPVTVPLSSAEPAPEASDVHDSMLGAKLEFLALFGSLTEMAIPLVTFSKGIDQGTLWMARAIYSETKLVHEQELVAWVIRNRVETTYRGQSTYRDVVLDPYQFSAFNPGSAKRAFYGSLAPTDSLPGWQRALRIAHYVRHADPVHRPFSIKTRHFYSEQSMVGRPHPHWVNNQRRVTPNWTYRVDQRRFRFYEAIS